MLYSYLKTTNCIAKWLCIYIALHQWGLILEWSALSILFQAQPFAFICHTFKILHWALITPYLWNKYNILLQTMQNSLLPYPLEKNRDCTILALLGSAWLDPTTFLWFSTGSCTCSWLHQSSMSLIVRCESRLKPYYETNWFQTRAAFCSSCTIAS